jgi:hypothetical protein
MTHERGISGLGFRYKNKIKPYMDEGAWIKKIKWIKNNQPMYEQQVLPRVSVGY